MKRRKVESDIKTGLYVLLRDRGLKTLKSLPFSADEVPFTVCTVSGVKEA